MNNIIIKNVVGCEYYEVNETALYEFLNEELETPDLHDYKAHFSDANNKLTIGNGCYELESRFTKSKRPAYFYFNV